MILAGLGEPVVQRTQEARVLETGREMVTADVRGWMIPRLNTELRLQKPPLAYWTAAAMFKIFGVGEWAGRLPFAIAGWLTIGVVYQIGRLLFDRGIALMAGLVMSSGFFYFRFARLAETDVLASLFVTMAIWLIILGKREERGRRWVIWLQLAGLCVGLAALAKGLPAVFPLIFAVVWALVERDKRLIMRLGASGGLVTALVLGGWWFLYLRLQPGAGSDTDVGRGLHQLAIDVDAPAGARAEPVHLSRVLRAQRSLVAEFMGVERATAPRRHDGAGIDELGLRVVRVYEGCVAEDLGKDVVGAGRSGEEGEEHEREDQACEHGRGTYWKGTGRY